MEGFGTVKRVGVSRARLVERLEEKYVQKKRVNEYGSIIDTIRKLLSGKHIKHNEKTPEELAPELQELGGYEVTGRR